MGDQNFPGQRRPRNATDGRAAIWAGIAAGAGSALAQVLLWLAFTDALPHALFRDARLTAAILLGQGVLPPPATFDAVIMLISALIHCALSIVYGLALAWVLARTGAGASLWIGALFGLALYAVNLYGFTALFPWFAQVRDWITITAHLVFGVTAARVYRYLERR
ncbi:MAG: sodium:proline symporter [Burkholderiales bacterium]